MASWKLCGSVLLCVLLALVAQGEGRRSGGGRRRQQQQRQGEQPNGVSLHVGRNGGGIVDAGDADVDGADGPCNGQGANGRRCRQQNPGRGGRRQNRRGGSRGNRRNRGRNFRNRRRIRLLSNAMRNFSLGVYSELSESNPDNFVFSPFSLFSAVAMMQIGSRGQTRSEVLTALNVGNRALHPAFRWYTSAVADDTDSQGEQFLTANALFHHPELSVRRRYRRRVSRLYAAHVTAFNEDFPEDNINTWVEDETNGYIDGVLSEGAVTEDDDFVLISAAYFQGNWEYPFIQQSNQMEEFWVTEDQSEPVEMLVMRGPVSTTTLPLLDARLVKLPYTGSRYAMFILMPVGGSSLGALESSLTAEVLKDLLRTNMNPQTMELHFPKFFLDAEEDMVAPLQGLGVVSVFDPATAHLRRLTSTRNVTISQVRHRVIFGVDESGTNAASSGAQVNPNLGQGQLLEVNRPFLFVLRDTKAKLELMMGRFTNPQGGNLRQEG